MKREIKKPKYNDLTDKIKKEIDNSIKKFIEEYGETLKLLGKK